MLLEAAWILAAIELNGAAVSRGASVRLTPSHCEVEHVALDDHLNPRRSDVRLADHWSFAIEHCRLDTAKGLLQIQLPQDLLATKTLRLGAAQRQDPVKLLHRPSVSEHNTVRVMPSASVDFMMGSNSRGLGLGISAGPWLFQGFVQKPNDAASLNRWSLEHLLASGAAVTLGDFRAETGPAQNLGEFRGLHITNQAQPLRNDASAFGELLIDRPARLQFFDRQGIPIYSAEILSPGNYQVQGYGSSSVPGFLEARLVDSLGRARIVSIPWTADRKLLGAGATLWEVFLGQANQPLTPQPNHLESSTSVHSRSVFSAQIRHGLSHRHSVGAHFYRSAEQTQWSGEVSSRAIPNLLASAALGRQCGPQDCQTLWLADARISLGRSTQIIANIQSSDRQTVAIGASTAFLSRGSGSWQWSRQSQGMDSAFGSVTRASRSTHTLSLRWGLGQDLSLQLQARHQEEASLSSWSGFIGLSMNLSRAQTTMTSYLTIQDPSSGGQREGATVQINRSIQGLYGTQLSATHRQEEVNRSEFFVRHASPFGDGSLRMDSQTRDLHWSASTRLWMTPKEFFFTATGDDNLVIQDIGKPSIRILQPGRDSQISNAQGVAVFRKAPAWLEASYSVDAKSLPFDLQLASNRLAIPLASRRVYWVTHANQWSDYREWRLEGINPATIQSTHHVVTRQGRHVFLTEEGYLDLRSSDELPVRLQPKPSLMNEPNRAAGAAGANGARGIFDCTERDLPGILECHPVDVLTQSFN